MGLPKRLIQQLNNRKTVNNFRELKLKKGLIDFSSNDYLGLSHNQELASYYPNNLMKSGATGSRLLSGNSSEAMELEVFLSSIFKSESALVLNSGYLANLALLSSVPQRSDTILYDELVHASIKDGMRLSLANRKSFKHNDLKDLSEKLKNIEGNKYVVVESIYSMDGDECPLREIIALCKNFDARLILDEAHATGVLGDSGGGLSEKNSVENNIFCRIYTFGKGIGLHGAAICGDQDLIDYLVNFARPFIYTTALPPVDYKKIKLHLEYIRSNVFIQNQLQSLIQFYLDSVAQIDLKRSKSKSAIQTVIIPGNDNVRKASELLQKCNLDVRPIGSPTVKEGQERLRICLHSFNTHDEVSTLVSSLATL